MSKFDSLQKLLVNGATLVLVKQSHGDIDQQTTEINRKLLVNGDATGGRITYIVAEPSGAHELGDRHLVVNNEDDLTVSKDGFTLTETVPETGEKLVRKYSVTQPAAGTFATPSQTDSALQEEGDKGGAVDAPIGHTTGNVPPATVVDDEASKKAK